MCWSCAVRKWLSRISTISIFLFSSTSSRLSAAIRKRSPTKGSVPATEVFIRLCTGLLFGCRFLLGLCFLGPRGFQELSAASMLVGAGVLLAKTIWSSSVSFFSCGGFHFLSSISILVTRILYRAIWQDHTALRIVGISFLDCETLLRMLFSDLTYQVE